MRARWAVIATNGLPKQSSRSGPRVRSDRVEINHDRAFASGSLYPLLTREQKKNIVLSMF
jgi:hypothetical protein